MTRTVPTYQRTYPVSPDGNPFVHNDLGLYTQNHFFKQKTAYEM